MSQFDQARAKYEKKKQKMLPDGATVNTTLPFVQAVPEPRKEKPKELSRPTPKMLEIAVSGPVSFSLKVDWVGTLMGGQMNEQTLKALFAKYLAPIGRVK